MAAILDNIYKNLDFFILVFIRITALIVSSPIFGRKTIPNIMKIGLCLFVTYIVFSANPQRAVPDYNGAFEFGILCIKELLFGLVLGFATTLFFSIVHTAGASMDMQIGFGMVNIFDTQNNISVPVTGNLLNIVMLVTFLGVGGHMRLIYIISSTFSQIPAGAVTLDPNLGLVALDVFILSFVLSVNVAMPLIAAGLLSEVALGFIVRAVPQVNVFVVGIPLKILLGFLVLLMVMPIFVNFTGVIFDRMFESINKLIAGLA